MNRYFLMFLLLSFNYVLVVTYLYFCSVEMKLIFEGSNPHRCFFFFSSEWIIFTVTVELWKKLTDISLFIKVISLYGFDVM